jgi:hypothetical protein
MNRKFWTSRRMNILASNVTSLIQQTSLVVLALFVLLIVLRGMVSPLVLGIFFVSAIVCVALLEKHRVEGVFNLAPGEMLDPVSPEWENPISVSELESFRLSKRYRIDNSISFLDPYAPSNRQNSGRADYMKRR